ncbi:hypothetical protein R4Z10_21495 (plasmid) [Niallia sp. XMNu-256]|uniref:hypothetical protein n=1 Tax=Niallia sp. XMNu-256 TaxID=3082444 RepID=UPI0030CD9C26
MSLETTCKMGQIELQLLTDKNIYSQGETIQAKGKIINKGNDPYTYRGSSTCDNNLYFSISNSDGHDQWAGQGSVDPKWCTDDLRQFQLTPQALIEKEATFPVNHDEDVYNLKCRYGNISVSIPIIVQ